VFSYKTDQHLLIATAAGYGFTCTVADMIGRNKAGKQFITVDKETILPPSPFTPAPHSIIAAVSAAGRLLLFLLADMKQLSGGGKGVIVMGLAEGDSLAAARVINQPELKVIGMVGSKEQQVKLSGNGLQEYFGARARGGKNLPTKMKPVRIE
jgi:topoisomerase-4 subunit A